MISAETAQARIEARLTELTKQGGAVTEIQRRRLRSAARLIGQTSRYPDAAEFEHVSLAPWLFFSGGERLRMSAAKDLPLDYLLWSRGEVWDLADAAEQRRYLDAAMIRKSVFDARDTVSPRTQREAVSQENRRAFAYAAAVAAGWLLSLAGGAIVGVAGCVLIAVGYEVSVFSRRRDPFR